MRPSMVNRALVSFALAVLLGTFRVFAGPLSFPLLGLSIFLGALGAVLMWLGLTCRSKEELESLSAKAKSLETSSGLYEILLVVTALVAAAIAIGILLAVL